MIKVWSQTLLSNGQKLKASDKLESVTPVLSGIGQKEACANV